MDAKQAVIAVIKSLGHGHFGDIVLTTQERIDNNEEPIAKDIIDEEHAEFLCCAANSHDELLKACKNLMTQYVKYTPHLNHAKCWEIIQAKAAIANAKKE